MPLLLTDSDVNQVMTMQDCVGVMEDMLDQAQRGMVWFQPRTHIRTPVGYHHIMPGAVLDSGVVGVKIYTARFPAGSRFLTVLHDSETGDLLALLQGGRCSQLRTGALSGVASKYMARQDAATVGIIGSGVQAKTQLEGTCAVRNIRSIRTFDIVHEKSKQFSVEMSELLNVEVTPAESAEACVKGADIVITMTTSPKPVLLGEWLEPGMHLSIMGSNHWTRREVDNEVISRADSIVVDNIEEAKRYSGDLLFTIDQGLVRWEQVHELVSVVAGQVPGRPSEDSITLFKSHGIGISDVAAAAYVYRKAKEKGLGVELPLNP